MTPQEMLIPAYVLNQNQQKSSNALESPLKSNSEQSKIENVIETLSTNNIPSSMDLKNNNNIDFMEINSMCKFLKKFFKVYNF